MILSSLIKFNRLIGVDLGSSTTRIWTDQGGMAIEAPSCIAVEASSRKVMAVGQDALEMKGRVQSDIEVFEPIQHGKVHDAVVAKTMLKVLLQQVLTRSLFSPVVMVSLPASSTEVMEQTVVRLFYDLGAREVYTIAQPLAAAIGAGVPIADASGCFILQLGGGIVEGGVISLGSLIAAKATERAGDRADQLIAATVKKKHQLKISQQTARKLKHQVGSLQADYGKKLLIGGQDLTQMAPQEVMIDSADIAESLVSLYQDYLSLLKKLLAQLPPELTADVIDKGLLLSGGLAKLHSLDQFLIAELGVPVSVVDAPARTVVKGIGTALEHLDLFKQSLGYQSRV